MSRGDKSSYTDKQKRKAAHIEESYESRGVPEEEAQARAWATVNKQSGGGEKSGSGQRKSETAKRAERKDSARRAAASRRGQSPNRGSASAREQSGSTSLSAMSRAALLERAAEQGVRGRWRMRKDELIAALS
ncbi:termination factor Rho [Azotobacter vinelandii]|uniref:termination factor Rho n=1 Tax=Azotobacter vinelandii TaxID=354 RepID=UPI002666C1F1|nr:termination factor Rho [Azotobacter vinelandii]WKN22678.1 termination factor Rho [Azotobacter vinelandii]